MCVRVRFGQGGRCINNILIHHPTYNLPPCDAQSYSRSQPRLALHWLQQRISTLTALTIIQTVTKPDLHFTQIQAVYLRTLHTSA